MSTVMADNFLEVAAVQCTIPFRCTERARQIQENRAQLVPIIFCGQQEPALWSTYESESVLQPHERSNDGNFRALLKGS